MSRYGTGAVHRGTDSVFLVLKQRLLGGIVSMAFMSVVLEIKIATNLKVTGSRQDPMR
jgi:hypothetical protein